jgi:DNA-binding IclR family transcriptional regulator
VLAAIADLGIADALAGPPADAERLGERLDLDADAVHRVLRAAAVEGLVRIDREGTFRLTRVGTRCDRTTPPRWLRSSAT